MTTDNVRYWGYRFDRRNREFFAQELAQGRLRAGWGYNQDQKLSGENLAALDAGTRRNLKMYREVKAGHILLVPRLPERHLVDIVQATQDWKEGYDFDIPKKLGDYGHIFPAKRVATFSRKARHVTGDLLKSLRARCRFWSMDWLADDIEALREHHSGEVTDSERLESAVHGAFAEAFLEDRFGTSVYKSLHKQFEGARWEGVLVEVLETTLYPPPCIVEKVSGGRGEAEHGMDIRISLPKLGHGPVPVVAVQVKDLEGIPKAGKVKEIKEQIKKMDGKEDDYRVVEKVVIMTKVSEERGQNAGLREYGEQEKVRMVFAEDLQKLLTDYGKRTMGLGD